MRYFPHLFLGMGSCEISPIYFGMPSSVAMFRSYLDSHIVEVSRVHCLLSYFKSLLLTSCEEAAKVLQFKECALDPRRLPPTLALNPFSHRADIFMQWNCHRMAVKPRAVSHLLQLRFGHFRYRNILFFVP